MNVLISKKHKISGFFSITLITIFLIAFQACNKNDESTGINELYNLKLAYLDTDISNLIDLNLKQSTHLKSAILSEQQMSILKEARTRIDGYIIYQPAKKMYCLKVSTGSQIQMSEKLFEFFKAQMMHTNTIIKDLDVIQDKKNSKRLHVVKNPLSNSTIRLKSANPEGDIPPLNSTDYDLKWSGVDIYISTHDLNNLALGTTSVAAFCAWFPQVVASKLIGFGATLTAAECAYLSAENPNGIIISMDWNEIDVSISGQVDSSGTW